MKKRYSYLIKPLQLIIDVLFINGIVYFFDDQDYLNFYFLCYISIFWIVTSYFFGFYKVYRYSRPFRLLGLLLKQFLIFFLGYFTYFGVFREGTVVNNQFIILVTIILSISSVKFLWFILLNKYRSLGNNSRTTIVVGFDDSSQNIIRLFKSREFRV